MAYVLIVVSFVAMGGPKDTTPAIDHIHFSSQQTCEAAKTALVSAFGPGRHLVANCLPE
jgi:hypothetical protein